MFRKPYHVEVNQYDEVTIYDKDDYRVCTYNTHTQLPLSDKKALKEELNNWVSFAKWQVKVMNSHA